MMESTSFISFIQSGILLGIFIQLVRLNGKIERFAVWQVSHDKQDDERHAGMTKRMDHAEELTTRSIRERP